MTQRLEALGERQSTLALALAVEPAEAEAYLCSAPECRAKAFFREGLIVLEPLQQPAAATNPAAQPTAPAALPLAREKVRPETAARFQEASLACQEAREKASDPEESNRTQDRARSAAEGFLFELLADLPETAGCFALNAPLDFCFGPKRAEVDLLAAGLRLAVEIDGYRHFQDAEAYRRDRRKDALLQKQGYLVLRFLAEDVVTRLEVILEEIRAAVAFRKVASGGQPS